MIVPEILILLGIYLLMIYVVFNVFDVFDVFNSKLDTDFIYLMAAFWPITFIVLIVRKVFEYPNKFFRGFLKWLKMGRNYYKGDIHRCCGQCIHVDYWKNKWNNDLCECGIRNITGSLGTGSCRLVAHDCKHFKKNPFWRFTIRIPNEPNAANKSKSIQSELD